MKQTDYGLTYQLVHSVGRLLSPYLEKVAQSHLDNYGIIVVDEYGTPIDNEHDLEWIINREFD